MRCKLPPRLHIHELDPSYQKPNPAELAQVLDLHHLARCLEVRYRDPEIILLTLPHDYSQDFQICEDITSAGGTQPEDLGNLEAWRERFDGALYTVLLGNAYLARWYREPLEVIWFRSYDEGGDMPDYGVKPERHGRKYEEVKKGVEELVGYGMNEWLKEKGDHKRAAERILSHPAWLMRVNLGLQEPLFGEFADWFVKVTLKDEARIERAMRPRDGLPRINAKLFNTGSQTWPETSPLGAYFRNGTPEQGRLLFGSVLKAIHMMQIVLLHLEKPEWVGWYVNQLERAKRIHGDNPRPVFPPRRLRATTIIGARDYEPCEVYMDEKPSTRYRVLAENTGSEMLSVQALLLRMNEHRYFLPEQEGKEVWREEGKKIDSFDPTYTLWYFILAREMDVHLVDEPGKQMGAHWGHVQRVGDART